MLTLPPKRVQTKDLKFFWLKIFPFSTTPVVHVELWIFEKKNRNGPNVILRGLEETDSWKKPEVENLVALSL
jgi:hypothetical protein